MFSLFSVLQGFQCARLLVCALILSVAVIDLSRHTTNLMRMGNLFTKVKQILLSLTKFFHSYFTKAIEQFYGFRAQLSHLGCWENSPKGLQMALAQPLVFYKLLSSSPNITCFYCVGKPLEIVVYYIEGFKTTNAGLYSSAP